MPTLADIRRWDPAALDVAHRALGDARNRLLNLDADLQRAAPPASWEGPTADRARPAHEAHAERLRRLTAATTTVRPALAEASDAILALRRDLDNAYAHAATLGFNLSDDGLITDVRQTLPIEQFPNLRQQRATEQAEIRGLLEQILRRAAEIDAALAAVLDRAAADRIDDGAGATLAGAVDHVLGPGPTPPPPGADPTQNAAWWNSLTPEQQEQVLLENPGWIGNLNGIPAGARDEANRSLLVDETARIDRELAAANTRWQAAAAEPLPPGMEGQGETRDQRVLREEVERLTHQRDAITAITAAIGPDRQLLHLDVSGGAEPRAAVAVGDVDAAHHVAVFTPGFTTTVPNSLLGYINDMQAVQDTAQRQLNSSGRENESVAAVAWLGYDAPQWLTTGDPDQTVATDAAAQIGGTRLAGFLDGINASRPDDPHLTALGHSYGSTTTGYALQQVDGVDDAVLFGSPGAATGDIADLRVPPGHVGVLEARGDGVADLGSFGGDTNQLEGVTNLSSRAETAPDGTPLRESEGHSEYLVPGTTSQHNVAATVAGLPDLRITGTNDGAGDILRNPPPELGTTP
jgi:hypothetical protein